MDTQYFSQLLVFLVPALIYFLNRWRNRRFYRVSAQLSGPVDLPFLGCGHLFLGKDHDEQFSILNNMTKDYQSPFRAWLGPEFVIFVDNPEDMQVVLNSQNCLEKADLYRFVGCERGLFSSPVNIWKVHRKLLSPCFSPSILASFVNIFNNKCAVLTQRIEKHLGNGAFDIYADISRCTLDMICATTLGTNMDLQSDEGTKYVEAIEEICELVNNRMLMIWLHSDFIYRRTKIYQKEQKLREEVYSMARKVLALKLQERDQFLKAKKKVQPEDQEKNRGIYIDEILRLAEETHVFDEQDMKDELDTIILGGNETSALTLSHVMLMLAMHEDVQERVYNEIISVTGSKDPTTPILYEQIPKLAYTEMTIKETMRLLPVGPLLARKCTAPTKISKTTIPEGTTVVLGVFNCHHNPKYWGPDVDTFRPDRFHPEQVASRHPYSYLPFSGGPRNCIGYKYGLISMKIMLCHLLRTYRFRSPITMDTLKLKISVTLKVANRNMVQIERRI
ncbi:probable cytochrome P450 313b1 [Uranotaenia lowii]|uniref:probable cytochrome P450 313b1 n=1 Tax=Uranotaenia lowii TaxID=190385 RepID=UPI0024783E11|nr:probable cytochrome P450 313b1 [Uranotaenia lowii]